MVTRTGRKQQVAPLGWPENVFQHQWLSVVYYAYVVVTTPALARVSNSPNLPHTSAHRSPKPRPRVLR